MRSVNSGGLLPADTRVPDHTIWQHLDLTAAFATALQAGEGNPALLTVSFGPVQEFIAQARTTSDLWGRLTPPRAYSLGRLETRM